MAEIVSIHRGLKLAITDDFRLTPLVTLIDRSGQETEDPASACAAVAEDPDGGWWAIDLDQFDEPTVQN